MIDTILIIKMLISLVASFFFIKLLIRFAPALGLVDVPNHRSIHNHVTPRGAGIGMVLAVMISDIVMLNAIVYSHIATFIAIFLVFIVGVLDDYRDTTPKMKFFVIFFAVFLLSIDNIVITSLGNFFGHNIPLGWFAIPFTMFAVAGFTNALNLSDGLDGLAGSLSIVILATLCVIGIKYNDPFIVSLSLSFIAAISAFMWFNWNTAKIFMGDSGSLTLGFVIALLSIKALTYIQPSAILFIAALPIIDTLIVMVRRKRNGKSMFTPDKLHMHHILLHFFNGNVRKTVILLVLLQLGFSIVGMAFSESYQQRYILALFSINVAIFYILLNGMLKRQNKFAFYREKQKKK